MNLLCRNNYKFRRELLGSKLLLFNPNALTFLILSNLVVVKLDLEDRFGIKLVKSLLLLLPILNKLMHWECEVKEPIKNSQCVAQL